MSFELESFLWTSRIFEVKLMSVLNTSIQLCSSFASFMIVVSSSESERCGCIHFPFTLLMLLISTTALIYNVHKRHTSLFRRSFSNKNIVVKVSFFGQTIRENHLSLAMLNPSPPFPFVDRAISPIHFSVPFPLIFKEISDIDIARFPFKSAIS